MKRTFWLLLICLLMVSSQAEAVIRLFEDEPSFINGFTQADGVPSIVNDAHFGTRSLRVISPVDSTSGQIYHANIPGWNFHVVANPQAANEIRWMMWAWKKQGPDGIMIQLARPEGWGPVGQPEVAPGTPVYRYFAGSNFGGWSAIRTAWHAPSGWQLVIRDLYADFGTFTLVGVAFTPYNGIGLYDSLYVGKTYNELLGAFQPSNTVIRVVAPGTVNDGEYFNCDITISNASNVSGFSFTIHYDRDVVKAYSVTEGGFLKATSPTFWLEPDIDNGDSIIHEIVCVRTQPGGASGSGVLLSVTFRARDKGESAIYLEDVAISDANGQLFPVAVENALVLVDDFPAWDVNGDGRVNLIDFIIVGQNFGKYIASGTEPNPDVNRNGVVDLADWIMLSAHYGEIYWDGAPGLDMIPPASVKPMLESMLRKILASDQPDSKAIAVTESLIDMAGKAKAMTWGRIKSQ